MIPDLQTIEATLLKHRISKLEEDAAKLRNWLIDINETVLGLGRSLEKFEELLVVLEVALEAGNQKPTQALPVTEALIEVQREIGNLLIYNPDSLKLPSLYKQLGELHAKRAVEEDGIDFSDEVTKSCQAFCNSIAIKEALANQNQDLIASRPRQRASNLTASAEQQAKNNTEELIKIEKEIGELLICRPGSVELLNLFQKLGRLHAKRIAEGHEGIDYELELQKSHEAFRRASSISKALGLSSRNLTP